MSGINQNIIFCVCRLKVTFCNAIGDRKVIVGTGFWLKTQDNKDIFITNKHNLDPCLKLGDDTEYKLDKVEIELRKEVEGCPADETKFFEVNNFKEIIKLHNNADVGIFTSPNFKNIEDDFKFYNLLKQNLLADKDFFKNSVALMDIGSFLGFAGKGRSKWWDQECNLGVARLINIASYPKIAFSHPDIITANTLLVSGLSFSGSSGSIVMLHEKGINFDKSSITGGPPYVPPKILGIMSGHWQEDGEIPEIFQHSGLSYLTRSDSILELIR